MLINKPLLERNTLNWFVMGIILLPLQLLFLIVWENYIIRMCNKKNG